MKTKKRLTLIQARNIDFYRVKEALNMTDLAMGEKVTKEEVDALICRGIEVVIKLV